VSDLHIGNSFLTRGSFSQFVESQYLYEIVERRILCFLKFSRLFFLNNFRRGGGMRTSSGLVHLMLPHELTHVASFGELQLSLGATAPSSCAIASYTAFFSSGNAGACGTKSRTKERVVHSLLQFGKLRSLRDKIADKTCPNDLQLGIIHGSTCSALTLRLEGL
jgi:hypothetical protein